MISSTFFLTALTRHGYRLFTGVPCSYLKPFINQVIDNDALQYVPAANEGDAVAIASGAELGAMPSVVMFQNSGLGNAVSPLTSLNAIFQIPVLLIVTWRGEPGGKPDEPQHALMGAITTQMLELIGARWEMFPTADEEVEPALERAVAHMTRTRLPYAFVMREGSVAPHPLASNQRVAAIGRPSLRLGDWPAELPSRQEALRVIQESVQPQDALIATTGYMGRALFAEGDCENQFYLVGAMGCASSLGLGLALAQPERRVIVIDGDGAALMRLGAFATIGAMRPKNLLHVMLDNERHASTGGQATVSGTTDLGQVAGASGYPVVQRASDLSALARLISADTEQLTFVHVKLRPDEAPELPRPAQTPLQVARRFRSWLSSTTPRIAVGAR